MIERIMIQLFGIIGTIAMVVPNVGLLFSKDWPMLFASAPMGLMLCSLFVPMACNKPEWVFFFKK